MAERERTEARNVTMYPDEWEAIDRAAGEHGFVTSRGPNTSLMLRQIVRKWQQAQQPQPAELESSEC